MNAVCLIKQLFQQYMDVVFFLQVDLSLFDLLDTGIFVKLLTRMLIVNSEGI